MRRTVKTLLLAATILMVPCMFAQRVMQQASPGDDTLHPNDAAACPLHLDDAHITAAQTGMTPAAPVQAERERAQPPKRMHVGIENVSGKTIVAFLTRAEVSLEPNQLTNEPEKHQTVWHSWTGELAAGLHAKEEWKFTPDSSIGSVFRVSFNKVKFADGTTWNRTPGDACSFRVAGSSAIPASKPTN